MRKKNQNGSAVLTVLGVISIVMVVCGMLGYSSTQQMRSSQITREMLKARLIAESGLNKAYNAVKNDFDQVAGYADQAAFGGGTYTVKSVALSGGETRRAQLISEGVCGFGRAVVSVDLENRPKVEADDDPSDDYFDLLFDLLVGGTLNMTGNFKADVTDIHANGSATLSGSAETDAKTVSSAGSVIWKKPGGTVTLLSNQSPVEILTEALLEAINDFIACAVKNGAVYASGAEIPDSPPGGVAYCTGDSSGWDRTGNGCFIFAGEASFQGNAVNVSSVNGYPALIVLGADEVKLNSGSVVHGAIIVPNGSVKLNGHADLYGPIVVGQGMTGNGTADLHAENGQGFNLPPEEELTDNVVVTAWH